MTTTIFSPDIDHALLVGLMSLFVFIFGVVMPAMTGLLIRAIVSFRKEMKTDMEAVSEKFEENMGKIADSFKNGLDRVAEAVSANREEYKGQLSEQKERVAIIETQIKPLDNLFAECRTIKTQIEVMQTRISQGFIPNLHDRDER